MIDTYEKLDIGIPQVDKIVHVSDIHIRLTKRHDEYRDAFSKLYAEIANTPTNTLIINTGDTFHSKVDLSPEAVQLACEFFKSLADLRPTIIIAGNHDCLLTNVTRLDSISPIIENLAHKNLFYLKENKLYGAKNVLINNMSIFADPVDFIKMATVTKPIKNLFDTKVALFHGAVYDSTTDIGYKVTNKSITTETFDGHDIAMLGDIHMIQDLQNYIPAEGKPVVRYAGSLLQQNHGEALTGHGFSLWDVRTRTYTHVEIPNDYGYFTVEVENGKLLTDITNLPKKPKLRVKCKETVATEVKRVVAEIREKYEISDLIFMRVDSNESTHKLQSVDVSHLNQIGSEDYQNKLITDCLKAKYPDAMDEDTLAAVLKINNETNVIVKKEERSKNIRWKPIKFEFSNMFSYGEHNVLDFTKLSDVYGLFAANASGKSSLMDALCFTIFDKSARAFKGGHVMNTQKMTFHGKFEFEINNVRYFIERKGTRDKKNHVKVDVDFYWMKGAEKVPLNSEQRLSTNEVIRNYMGAYEDFVLTSLALQGNQGSFIGMGQTDRKELLSQFIGLDLFDRLYIKASDAVKEINGAIKTFNKENSLQRVITLSNDLLLLDAKLLDLASRKEAFTNKKQQLEDTIKVEESKVVKLQNVPTSITGLQSEKASIQTFVATLTNKIAVLITEIAEKKVEHDSLLTKLNEFDAQTLKEKNEKYTSLTRTKQKIENDVEKLKAVVREKRTKVDLLTKNIDLTLDCCSRCSFTKDAIATQKALETDKANGRELMEKLKTLNEEIALLEPFIPLYQNLANLNSQISGLSAIISKKELEKVHAHANIDVNKAKVIEIEAKIELYEKSKTVVEANRIVESEVKRLNTELYGVNSILKTISAEHIEAYSKKVSSTDQKRILEEQIEKIEGYETQSAAYQYYLTAIGKDGVPYQIISDVVPSIEQEVNNILSQIVEFTMDLETDGKNVNAYIKYEDRRWPLELCSGMEKFMASLALRVALINISNLPRPNFLVVDEGFSALDASNMPLVHSLFDYLKSNFDFIIIISHLDAMRDMVDKQLEIKKENGFSKLDNTV